MSMCLERAWNIGFSANLRADRLSIWIVVGPLFTNPSSDPKPQNFASGFGEGHVFGFHGGESHGWLLARTPGHRGISKEGNISTNRSAVNSIICPVCITKYFDITDTAECDAEGVSSTQEGKYTLQSGHMLISRTLGKLREMINRKGQVGPSSNS